MRDPEPISDSQAVALLRGISQNDSSAFARLYDEFSTSMFSLAIAIVKNRSEAEDVLQEVFLLIWNQAATYDPALGKPLSWILTLTRNKAIDRLRSLRRRSLGQETLKGQGPLKNESEDNPQDATMALDDGHEVRNALQQLPPSQRQAIHMAFFGGLTHTEIAEELQEPLGTIKARIRRGLNQLCDKLRYRLEN